jgi:hypothetical protein
MIDQRAKRARPRYYGANATTYMRGQYLLELLLF